MSRWRRIGLIASPLAMPIALVFTASMAAQDKPAPEPAGATTVEEGQLPPEEDKAEVKQVYSFNPLQSRKEVTVGDFYMKKGDFKAAVLRFREATKWNDGNAEAWQWLGEADEK